MSETLNEQSQVIEKWVKENAIPIQHVESGNGFGDMQPLKRIRRDVKVAGLGEATHGTREFQQFKHRMLEFLVTEMGFTVFTIESSSAAGAAINEYIVSGAGDLETALSNQGYLAWDTEEFKDMLRWMREYNVRVPVEKKIH